MPTITESINIGQMAGEGPKQFITPACLKVDNLFFDGATAQTVSVPDGANLAIFTCTGNFYMRVGAAASLPLATTTDQTGSALNPAARIVNPRAMGATSTLSFISGVTSSVLSIEWYS